MSDTTSTIPTTNSAFSADPIGGEPRERITSVDGFTTLYGSRWADVTFAQDRWGQARQARVPLSSLTLVVRESTPSPAAVFPCGPADGGAA